MNKKLLVFSLPCILSLVAPMDSFAAIRVGNNTRSNADTYRQMTMAQQQVMEPETVARTAEETIESLPVRVASADLAAKIASGDTTAGVDIDTLDKCSKIYPSGEFSWDRPTAGTRANTSATCVSTVEMRVMDGTNDIIVARVKLAAGDSIDCNIEKFPEYSYTPDAYKVTFPADRAPTVDDVKKVMNQEQKKHAGFKIAAGAIIGGLGGNAASKNEVGKSSVIGGKQNAGGTIGGALTGAAIMTGASYGGKVAGDMILSAGVNAVAGGIVGNIAASGDSVLRIEECTINSAKKECLWGVIEKNAPLNTDMTKGNIQVGFYNIDDGKTVTCTQTTTGAFTNCTEERLIAMRGFNGGYANLEDGITDQNFKNAREKYTLNDTPDGKTMTQGNSDATNGRWLLAKEAGRPTQRIAAMVPAMKDKSFGVKMKDWYKWRTNNPGAEIYGRDSRGEVTDMPLLDAGETWSLDDFYPVTIEASDGGVIDLNNKARAKGTAIGAGVGGGLGAFTAYQGAADEIDARWASEVMAYKDSLQKVYCGTGGRFLSFYNETVIIPNMQ